MCVWEREAGEDGNMNGFEIYAWRGFPVSALLQLLTLQWYDVDIALISFWFVFYQGMKGNDNMYSDSDDDQHDAYLERMKEEGKIREEANDSDDSEGESGEWQLSEPIILILLMTVYLFSISLMTYAS